MRFVYRMRQWVARFPASPVDAPRAMDLDRSPAPQTSRAVAFLLCFLALVYAVWRFLPAFEPGFALANWGDGIGTIGSIAHFRAALESEGWRLFWGDEIAVRTINAGDAVVMTLTLPWKIALILPAYALSPDDVYDGIALAAFFFTLLSGYAVCRIFGASRFIAALGAIALAHMDNFTARQIGHLGLATYFVSLLQVGMAHAFARTPTSRNAILFALVSALAFAENEYYGYFGLVFAIAYFAAARVLLYGARPQVWGTLFRSAAVSAVVFIALMVFLYPSLVGARLLPGLLTPDMPVMTVQAYARSEFSTYGVPNAWGFVAPALWFGGAWWNAGNPGEFTFRLGLFPVLLLAVSAAAVWMRAPRSEGWRLFRQTAALLIPAAVMVLFAFPENRFWSLSKLTFAVAPMFRVSARAYLFVDFAVVIALSVALTLAVATVRERRGLGSIALAFALAFGLVVAFVDINGGRPLRVNALELPTERMKLVALRNAPAGMVLELPYLPPATTPESGYLYNYGYEWHRKPMANAVLFGLQGRDPDLANKATRTALRLNALAEKDIAALGHAGIRYIVIHAQGFAGDLDSIARSKAVRKIFADDRVAMFEILPYRSSGNFWGDFVIGDDMYLQWEGCGPSFEMAGVVSRTCPARFALVVKNYGAADVSGVVSCDVDTPVGSWVTATSIATKARAVSAAKRLDVPFAASRLGQQRILMSLSGSAGAVGVRGCEINGIAGVAAENGDKRK